MPDEVQTFEETFEPEQEYVVTSLDTLKVASDPTRLRILECLVERPQTVKEVASRLGSTPTKLYYHVNLLEEHGLIKVVSQRIVSGIIEKQYRTRAYSFNVDKSLFALNSSEEGGPMDTMLKAIFDATRDDVRRAIEHGLLDPTEKDPVKRNGLTFRSIAKLSPDRLREFQERLLALVKEFGDFEDMKEREKRGDTLQTYGLTVALFPFVNDMPNTRTTID
jgi:DNA-binding transcriptional ArsR family regulator